MPEIKVVVTVQAPEGATHYFGDLLDHPIWVKSTQIGVAGDHWWRWDATKQVWFLVSHFKPHWLKEIPK